MRTRQIHTPSTFRLSPDARRILRELAGQLGITMTAVIELALREKAKRARQEARHA